MILSRLLMLALLTLCISCSPPKPREVTRAYFYWKTKLELSATEQQALDSLRVGRLYVRMLDVAWLPKAGQVVPVSESNIVKAPAIEVVPVVFIANEALQHIKGDEVDTLAARIARKLKGKIPQLSAPVKEVQFDCDWTLSTKETYFSLLNALKKEFATEHYTISATIRLHQIKYADKTGVPPVDRGMLMCYNTGKITDPNEANSILQVHETAKYLGKLNKYALPLDAALPLYSWGVLFRDGQFIVLINAASTRDMKADSLLEAIDSTHFRVTRNGFYRGYHLRHGDVLRVEEISPQLALQAAQMLSDQLSDAPLTISFYHLDDTNLQNYTHAQIDTLYRCFSR